MTLKVETQQLGAAAASTSRWATFKSWVTAGTLVALVFYIGVIVGTWTRSLGVFDETARQLAVALEESEPAVVEPVTLIPMVVAVTFLAVLLSVALR